MDDFLSALERRKQTVEAIKNRDIDKLVEKFIGTLQIELRKILFLNSIFIQFKIFGDSRKSTIIVNCALCIVN